MRLAQTVCFFLMLVLFTQCMFSMESDSSLGSTSNGSESELPKAKSDRPQTRRETAFPDQHGARRLLDAMRPASGSSYPSDDSDDEYQGDERTVKSHDAAAGVHTRLARATGQQQRNSHDGLPDLAAQRRVGLAAVAIRSSQDSLPGIVVTAPDGDSTDGGSQSAYDADCESVTILSGPASTFSGLVRAASKLDDDLDTRLRELGQQPADGEQSSDS